MSVTELSYYHRMLSCLSMFPHVSLIDICLSYLITKINQGLSQRSFSSQNHSLSSFWKHPLQNPCCVPCRLWVKDHKVAYSLPKANGTWSMNGYCTWVLCKGHVPTCSMIPKNATWYSLTVGVGVGRWHRCLKGALPPTPPPPFC